MSIKYVYLEPGSPFSAEALNSRFAAAETGINTLTLEDLSVGALHSDHMPSPVGPNDVVPSAQTFSAESSYSTADGVRYDEEPGAGDGTWYDATQTLSDIHGGAPILRPGGTSDGLVLGADQPQRISAVILLANICISKISVSSVGSAFTGMNGVYEDRDGLAFAFKVTDSAGESAILFGSQRATSPGATIKYANAQPFPNDRNCDRDVPLRYVVTKTILNANNLIDIHTIEIAFQRPYSGYMIAGLTFFLSKWNMTAIPIQATTDLSYL